MSAASRITVRHADQNYGPYNLEQVNAMLAAGRLDEADLAWVEGTPDWQRLGAIPGVVRVPPVHGSRQAARGEDESERLILPAFLLAFFLGPFGVHRFYCGRTGSGIAMLVLTITVVGALVTGIWALVDWILIVTGSFRDGDGKLLKRWS